MKPLRVAVQGCCHGELRHIYEAVSSLKEKPDILLVLGDFQSLVSAKDFRTCSIPPKYARLGDFHLYHSGKLKAPILTVFIGGNHENMGQLTQLPFGGYIAENIYYMGAANVINFMGVRIGGLSGIYKDFDHLDERPEWDKIDWNHEKRNTYHVRDSELVPLAMMRNRMSLVMSHDWPAGIANHGNLQQLLKYKPFLREEITNNTLGSPLSWYLLKRLKPLWWTSAHMHVRFTAECTHDQKINDDEIDLDLDLDMDGELDIESVPQTENKVTNFIALDKCKKGDYYRHMTEITLQRDASHPTFAESSLYWEPEFLANLKLCQSLQKEFIGRPLQSINVDELRESVQVPAVSDWDDYRIPLPEDYNSPIKQTQYLTEKFLR